MPATPESSSEFPLVCLIGRPNVGKSSLFNALLQEKRAIVADTPGVTRDRHMAWVERFDRGFYLIDTGGIMQDKDNPFDADMREQLEVAVQEADVIWLVIDGHQGLRPDDKEISNWLRRFNKKIVLLINKADGADLDAVQSEAYELGFDHAECVSAKYSRGLRRLVEYSLPALPMPEAAELEPEDEAEHSIEAVEVTLDEDILPEEPVIALFGRPNAGKSTLLNQLSAENRAIVSDIPGTTRDAITLALEHKGKPYRLIDTAGLRRQAKVQKQSIEYFANVRTLNIAKRCHVAIIMVDASDGVAEQDVRLIGLLATLGRPMMVISNKWDLLDTRTKEHFKNEYKRRLPFLDYVEPIAVSAKTGFQCDQIIARAFKVYASLRRPLSTSQLTRFLERAVEQHQPPSINHHRIKLRFAHPVGRFPIRIAIHGKQVDKLPPSYQRYLERYFRTALELDNIPIHIQYMKDDNPFAGKKK